MIDLFMLINRKVLPNVPATLPPSVTFHAGQPGDVCSLYHSDPATLCVPLGVDPSHHMPDSLLPTYMSIYPHHIIFCNVHNLNSHKLYDNNTISVGSR